MILANHGIISSSGGLPPLNIGLVSMYKAESNANDSFGTNNGTAQGGLTYATGKSVDSFVFNGTNSYVQLPEDSMRFNDSFSVEFWLKTSSNQSSVKGLFGDYYYGSNGYGYVVFINPDSTVGIYWRNGSTDNDFSSTTSVVLNQWNHICVTWDKVNTNFKIYLNGTLSNQVTNANANNITYAVGSNRTNIGTFNSNSSNVLNGAMDEIGVWNKVLTQSEITELQTKYYPF